MILYINTKEQNKISVTLRDTQGKLIKSLSAQNKFGSQVLLPLVTKLLKNDINAIEVETGPGSFTGLRVGVAVANALGYALNIPVNGKKTETNLVY